MARSDCFGMVLVENAFPFLAQVCELWQRLTWFIVPVEPELEEKDWVEKHWGDRQNELDYIEAIGCVKERSIRQKDRFNGRLQEGQGATSEIEAHVFDGPAFRTLPLPVEVDLRQIFRESDCSLGVAHHEERVCLVWKRSIEGVDPPVHEHSNVAANEENDPEFAYTALIASLVNEDLGQLDRSQGECMQSKDQVLICNLLNTSLVK